MDIKRVCVLADCGRKTWAAAYVALYEVKCYREKMKLGRKGGVLPPDSFKVTQDVPEWEGPIQNVTLEGEYARIRKVYGPAVVDKAYPTEDLFAAEFNDTCAVHGIGAAAAPKVNTQSIRNTLPIESIKGIGPATADGIADVLGDGDLASLSIADPVLLMGVEDMNLVKAKRFINAAKDLIGDADIFVKTEE